MKKLSAVLFVLFALVSLGSAQAPAATPNTTKTDYSQEPYVIRSSKNVIRFEKDGTGKRNNISTMQVNTDLGVQQLGQLVFGYSSSNDKISIDYVRVHKPDGTVITANADAIQDLSGQVAQAAPMYTDFRQKHVTVPALRPGDLLEFSITDEMFTALAPNQYWLSYDFDSDRIILSEELEINLPADKPTRLKVRTGFDPKITQEGDRKVYRWTYSNLKHKTEEEKKAEYQRRLKQHGLDQSAIQMTSFRSWEELGAWYAPLQQERMEITPELRAKAQELAKDKATDLEKVRAIYDYVAPGYRYVSLSFGTGRYQPHAAGEIFANRYGDCKDKHTLLATMLKAVGIHADPVLIHSTRRLDPELPSPGQFDHVITLVTLGKQHIWLDTTAEVAPFQLLSFTLRDRDALWVNLDGKAEVIRTPADAPELNVQKLTMNAKISEVGTLSAELAMSLRGDSELLMRYAFRSTPEARWEDLVRNTIQIRGDITEISTSPVTDTSKAFEVHCKINLPNYMDWSSKNPEFDVPLPRISSAEFDEDDAEAGLLQIAGAPMEWDFNAKVEIPAKYSISLPLPASVTRPYGFYKVTYSADKNVISARRIMRMNIRELQKEQLGDYASFRRVLIADQAQHVALETSVAGPAKLPEGLKADDLVAAGNAAQQNRNFSAAIESFKRATEVDPKNKQAWRGLGGAYLAMQRNTEAIAAFRKQLELNQYDERAHYGIGMALNADRKYPDAEEEFRKQLEVNPFDVTTQNALAFVLVEDRKWSEARTEMEKAVSLSPKDALLRASMGSIYIEVGETDKGIASFDKAVELAPNSTVWNNVAFELARHKLQLERAQQYAESAVSEVSSALRNVDLDRLRIDDYGRVAALGSFWDTLGWVHFQRGNYEQAEKYLKAGWLLSVSGESGFHLGQLYEKMGRTQDAAEYYAMSLTVKRSYLDSRTALQNLLKDPKKADAALKAAEQKVKDLPDTNLGLLSKEKGEADFALVFSPGPRLEGARFLSGDDKMKELAQKLSAAKYPVAFPDGTPTKLVRRGTISCTPDRGCMMEFQAPDAVTSAD